MTEQTQLELQLQHVNVKLLTQKVPYADLEPLVPMFHEWIQSQAPGELLLDVADYRHVPAGPVVILIGHEGDYSVDNSGNRLGVRYNRKAALDGTNGDRLEQAARAALTACRRLQTDTRLAGKLQFNGHDVEISINDRLLAPNSDSTKQTALPDFRVFAQKLFRGTEYSINYDADTRRLFGISLKSAQSFSVEDLLKSLG